MARHEINPARVDRALDMVDHWMPDQINVPAELKENKELLANPLALTYLKRKQAA